LFIISEGDIKTVLPNKKPIKRPEPKSDPPVVADEVKMQCNSTGVAKATSIELAYIITRSGQFRQEDIEDGVLPWGPFHANMQAESSPVVSTVAFNPILVATPTDPSTVYLH
jgi:hypothetical protein